MRRNKKFPLNLIWLFSATYALFALGLVAVLALFLYFYLSRNTFEDIRTRAKNTAVNIAQEIDVDLHESLVDPEQEESENYKKIQDRFKFVVKLYPELKSIYTLRKTDQPHILSFVIDSAETKDLDGNGVIDPHEEKAHLGELYDASPLPEMEKGFIEPSADKEITEDKWGQWISGYAPIKDKSGKTVAILGVDIEAQYYFMRLAEIKRMILFFVSISLVLSLLFGIWVMLIFQRLNKQVIAKSQELSSIVKNSPFGIYTISKKGVIDSINPKMLQIAGAESPKQMIGLSALELPNHKEVGFDRTLREGLGGRFFEKELFISSYLGRGKSYLRYSGVPLLDSSGKNVERLLVLVEDITERKRLEEKLAKYTEELEEEFLRRTQSSEILKEQYRAVVEGSLAGIYVLQGKVFRYANPAFLKIFGYKDLEEILGKSWQSLVYKEDLPRVLRSGIEERKKGKGKPSQYSFRALKKDGTVIEVEVLSNPGFFEGKPAIIGSLHDITERKQAEKRLKELHELRKKFIQIVSHQLRTPLSSVRWNLETILGEELGKLKKEQKEFLRITYEANAEVIRRINDLLTAFDIEEKRIIVTKEKVSLEGLWNSVITECKKKCRIKQVSFFYNRPPKPLPFIDVDSGKIRAVLEKLVDNAITYTKEKGKIYTLLKQKNGFVYFEIKDTGIGIPKTEQPRIFERFYRASNAFTMKPDASGLGLYIAKSYIEQHDGKIGFTSKEEKGSTFWFELPVK